MSRTEQCKLYIASAKHNRSTWSINNKRRASIDVTVGCEEVVVETQSKCIGSAGSIFGAGSCNYCGIAPNIDTVLHCVGLIFNQDTCAHSLNVACVNKIKRTCCGQCCTNTIGNTIGLSVSYSTASGCFQGSVCGYKNCFVERNSSTDHVVNIVFAGCVSIL